MELWLEGYVTFDGEVLEQFHFRENYCGRRHVATIADVQLKHAGGMHYIDVTTVFGAMNLMLPFPAERRAQAERLALALRSARRR